MMDLGGFLTAAGKRRRIPNEWDCCSFPAAWAMANGWPDPMAFWRGAYSSEEEGLQFIAEAGGLAALFDAGMGKAGIPRAQGEPLPGYIGVIQIGGHEAGAIFTGKRWALVADRGIGFGSVAPADVVAMWCING